MRALSIQQPWAWLIVNGYKDVENRTWSSGYRGPVLIHAGRRPAPDFSRACEVAKYLCGVRPPAELQYGGIVGIATITDCVTSDTSPWFGGPYGFRLRDARPLPFVACKGALGFFEVAPAVSAALQLQGAIKRGDGQR